MSDKRIIDLEAKQTLGSGDYLAADSAQGTYKVDANTNIMTPLANVRNNVANSSASPDKYSSSTAYKVGDMVIQNDILYKCTTACSAASWAVNSACFTATTLASVVTQLNSDLTNMSDKLEWSTNEEIVLSKSSTWVNTHISVTTDKGKLCAITFLLVKSSGTVVRLSALYKTFLLQTSFTSSPICFRRADLDEITDTILLACENNKLYILNNCLSGHALVSFYG